MFLTNINIHINTHFQNFEDREFIKEKFEFPFKNL